MPFFRSEASLPYNATTESYLDTSGPSRRLACPTVGRSASRAAERKNTRFPAPPSLLAHPRPRRVARRARRRPKKRSKTFFRSVTRRTRYAELYEQRPWLAPFYSEKEKAGLSVCYGLRVAEQSERVVWALAVASARPRPL